MHDLVRSVTNGSLLHDIGKVLHRGSNTNGRAHSISGHEWISRFTDDKLILDCIRYHHHQDLSAAGLEKDSGAYIVYLADNIASGADRREIEGIGAGGFNKSRPQDSIYNLLNNNTGQAVHKTKPIGAKINYPQEPGDYQPGPDYNRIIAGFSDGLAGIDFQGEYVNSLLELTEAYLSYIPSSTYLGEVADISLFDHSKITAALAACIALYLESGNRTDYYLELFKNSRDFYLEKAFCLFSCDISGIQQFIYTISSKGALKGLRARSFYLELLLENLVDEILRACLLYRTNLLYTGGGHAYLLLPNTTEAREKAEEAVRQINSRLLEYFGARLFVAWGIQACSAEELMSKTTDPESYVQIFRSLSAQIAENKLRRYSADDIRLLNSTSGDMSGRECGVCGVSGRLVERDESAAYCETCAAFTDISSMLIKTDTVFVVASQELKGTFLPLFSARGKVYYFYACQVEKARELLRKEPEKVVRIYSKNTYRTGFNLATRLWLGDYAVTGEAGGLKTFAELAAGSQGIKRIGVLRADVDNMGAAFVSGFIREQAPGNEYRYLTLSRTTTLSRSLSIFFKYYLNDLLANGEYDLLAPAKERNIVVVYSGGDDLFLVGAWNEVLAAAIDIRRAFARYAGGTLTLSAGFAIFEPGYPIARMAAETALLEEQAKQYCYKGREKNSLSLFGLEIGGGQLQAQARHTYDWDTFEEQVLGEKFATVDSILAGTGDDYGNSYLYNIVDLLRRAPDDGINIARLAYLLARREPDKKAGAALKDAYNHFSRNVYQWALNDEDRQQLITAIMLYIYYNRDEREAQA